MEKLRPHCGKTQCEIDHDKSGRFEYIPAKFSNEFVRSKLTGPRGQGKVSIPPLPPTP
jgi:hypothetical protein